MTEHSADHFDTDSTRFPRTTRETASVTLRAGFVARL